MRSAKIRLVDRKVVHGKHVMQSNAQVGSEVEIRNLHTLCKANALSLITLVTTIALLSLSKSLISIVSDPFNAHFSINVKPYCYVKTPPYSRLYR